MNEMVILTKVKVIVQDTETVQLIRLSRQRILLRYILIFRFQGGNHYQIVIRGKGNSTNTQDEQIW